VETFDDRWRIDREQRAACSSASNAIRRPDARELGAQPDGLGVRCSTEDKTLGARCGCGFPQGNPSRTITILADQYRQPPARKARAALAAPAPSAPGQTPSATPASKHARIAARNGNPVRTRSADSPSAMNVERATDK